MHLTRRQFVRGGVTAFTVGIAAPSFLSDLARAQGGSRRNLVVLYFGGGNDALSTLVPYTDAQYYARRPNIAVPAGTVLQVGSDSSGRALGLHPRLTGLKAMFDAGRLAVLQRTGYDNSSRSHFQGTDIWSSADPAAPQGTGWLGRYLDRLPAPVDPLVAWSTLREIPRTLLARSVGVPCIPDVAQYAFASPNGGADAVYARDAMMRMASHVPLDAPHLSFVNGTTRGALATLDRIGQVAAYRPTVTYPGTGLGLALRAVAGAMTAGIGTRVFWVQIGGFDTHAGQAPNAAAGTYSVLMATVDASLTAFYTDLVNHGLINDTLLIQFSEFGRRIDENGSAGTDHGAAGLMLALGGGVRGGLYGTAADLRSTPDNPTLENSGRDVHHAIDFRSVYATIVERWLGADPVAILGGDFRGGPAFL